MLYTRLSSWTGIIGQSVTDVPSGLSLTPPQETKKEKKKVTRTTKANSRTPSSKFVAIHDFSVVVYYFDDRLCGLVVRVSGYRSRDPRFDSRRYQILWEIVDLERGPLSLVSITEELLEWESSGSGSRKPRLTAVGIRFGDHATSYIRKSWH
jgi:hypothetical protein